MMRTGRAMMVALAVTVAVTVALPKLGVVVVARTCADSGAGAIIRENMANSIASK